MFKHVFCMFRTKDGKKISAKKKKKLTKESAECIWMHINQNCMQMYFRSALAQFCSNPDVSLAQATYIPLWFGLELELLLPLI